MREALSWLLLAALATHMAAHVALLVALARKRQWRRVGLALLLPPFAPAWGWRLGMRIPVYAWVGALAVYALGVAAA